MEWLLDADITPQYQLDAVKLQQSLNVGKVCGKDEAAFQHLLLAAAAMLNKTISLCVGLQRHCLMGFYYWKCIDNNVHQEEIYEWCLTTHSPLIIICKHTNQ